MARPPDQALNTNALVLRQRKIHDALATLLDAEGLNDGYDAAWHGEGQQSLVDREYSLDTNQPPRDSCGWLRAGSLYGRLLRLHVLWCENTGRICPQGFNYSIMIYKQLRVAETRPLSLSALLYADGTGFTVRSQNRTPRREVGALVSKIRLAMERPPARQKYCFRRSRPARPNPAPSILCRWAAALPTTRYPS